MYKTLETVPYKKFIKIIETDQYYILSKEDKYPDEFTEEEHEAFKNTWDKIYKDYLQLALNEEDKKTLHIKGEIEFLESKHRLVLIFCDCLRFAWNDDMVSKLRSFGYQLTDGEEYYNDINAIELEAEDLIIKCEKFIQMLPKEDNDIKQKYNPKTSIDDMFASFVAILGVDFDFETISFTKTMSLKKQVEMKIKLLDKNKK